MSLKERKLVTILGSILLILIVTVVVVLSMRHRDTPQNPDSDGNAPENTIIMDQTVYTSLTYHNGTATLSFSKDKSGIWHWDADDAFPLDDSVIVDLLEQLTNWHPQQTLTDTKALEQSGVEEPSASLSASTEDGTTTSLVFGKKTTDGKSSYVRLNGDETTVYIVDNAIRTLMGIPIYEMCRLPSLPVLEESRIQSIQIQGSAGEQDPMITVLTAQHAEGDSMTTWRFNGANVTDEPLVRSLLEDLATLSFAKCLDYNPSDEAAKICGMLKPSAVLEVSYVTESGSQQSLTLTIGNQLDDRSGRYTRLNDENTLYLLTTDFLDPLMRLASNGLEA